MSDAYKGGFNISSVGGGFSVTAGGDVVAGDKVTTTSTTTVSNGFKREDDKKQFVHDIGELRTALREIQTKIQQAPAASQDDLDEIVADLMQQVNALNTAKEQANSLPVGQDVPSEKAKQLASYLQSTGTLLDKVNELGKKAVKIGDSVKPVVEKALPLLLSARALFGLP